MSKLKIDVRQGILEVEGEEAFIASIYNDFKDRLARIPDEEFEDRNDQNSDTTTDKSPGPANPPKRRRTASLGRKESYAINKDLDLYGKGGHQPLKELYDQKRPSSALERNTVFVYYLKHILNKEKVNLSDIYSCYKALDVPAPGSFKQSVADTSSSRYGWIDANDMDDITIPLVGEQFVEHQLPRAGAPKKAAGNAEA